MVEFDYTKPNQLLNRVCLILLGITMGCSLWFSKFFFYLCLCGSGLDLAHPWWDPFLLHSECVAVFTGELCACVCVDVLFIELVTIIKNLSNSSIEQ